VLHDNPQLTARLSGRTVRQPLRVILDSRLRIPLKAQVLSTKSGGEILIVTAVHASKPRIEKLQRLGATVLTLPAEQGRVSLHTCLIELGKRGITSVLLEGGSEMNASAFSAGLVNRVRLYIATMVLGGQDAKGIVGGASPASLTDAWRLKDLHITRVGEDILLEATVPQNHSHSL
jgi:diaminohydroxyphosphoribosylaminopyrimidine deaminase / 5-amino-6-(5-phosphoribosylamino)uracil reductase